MLNQKEISLTYHGKVMMLELANSKQINDND